MTEAQEIAEHVSQLLPNVIFGAVRMWGVWFGDPRDNQHSLVSCSANNDCLMLRFDNDETLSIWSPRNCEASTKVFRISEANHVRWEWFCYGEPKTTENFCYIDLVRTPAGVHASTNVTWDAPDLRPDMRLPAAEILQVS